MTALSSDRKGTIRVGLHGNSFDLKVAADVVIYRGALVAVDDVTGLAKPADGTTNSDVVFGCSEEQVDSTGLAAGEVRCKVTASTWILENAGGITQVHVGNVVYVSDDQTVTEIQGTAPICGVCVGVEDDGRVAVTIDPVMNAAAIT